MQDNERKRRDEIYSIAIKAGKRTYFFDVKETRRGDYYLTLTESKKVFDREGNFRYEKHKIFLYKEDFDKFSEALSNSISYIKENAPEVDFDESASFKRQEKTEQEKDTSDFSDVKFEDLDSDKEKEE
ncbi:MAG TPA: DUF3276 family protein [Bacteroidales bacterium]|jgi:hypothetical protein|nr:DUF3276 family protein [Bacteroidales bacterium]MDD4236373.1 DUF3276 family protein [Bacteroidales bacterium]MDY0161292.1 DUF3276 family protein [Bacteroidales bacterium]HRW21594.1 DUF3276 family protein [Bacteroidales bacterium]HXK82402.1 DUF3276 family protein [Bacteroidales bacterium]